MAEDATAKKRTFRKYAYRGVDLDQLLDMNTGERGCPDHTAHAQSVCWGVTPAEGCRAGISRHRQQTQAALPPLPVRRPPTQRQPGGAALACQLVAGSVAVSQLCSL